MPSGLNRAREFAESIRYLGDRPGNDSGEELRSVADLSSFFKHNELRICNELTPALYEVLSTAASRLRMMPEQIEAYVYESPTVQASCIVRDGECCLIRASSGLVNLLSPEELAFVLGHEIGHHLLGHSHAAPEDRSPEEQLAARAAEISADRIGLVACGSIDVAVRALMKSLSGLPDRMIRFDVGRYLAQFADATMASMSDRMTHPSMGVRCRALLWYATTIESGDHAVDATLKSVIDDRVARDLHRFIDHEVNSQIQTAERNVALWTAVLAIVRDGRMSKAERAWLEESFGSDSAAKVIGLLNGSSAEDARKLAESRRDSAILLLKDLAPKSWNQRESAAIRLADSKPD